MENNDILVRVRYALDIKNTDMVEMFRLGGIEKTKEEVLMMLTKSNNSVDEEADSDYELKCNNTTLDAFLNGLITFNRGPQKPTPGQENNPSPQIKNTDHVNNNLLKKMKIALSLTSDDMLDIFDMAGIYVSKGELGAILRKKGHKNYKECGDKFARNFLKGLTLKYRS